MNCMSQSPWGFLVLGGKRWSRTLLSFKYAWSTLPFSSCSQVCVTTESICCSSLWCVSHGQLFQEDICLKESVSLLIPVSFAWESKWMAAAFTTIHLQNGSIKSVTVADWKKAAFRPIAWLALSGGLGGVWDQGAPAAGSASGVRYDCHHPRGMNGEQGPWTSLPGNRGEEPKELLTASR